MPAQRPYFLSMSENETRVLDRFPAVINNEENAYTFTYKATGKLIHVYLKMWHSKTFTEKKQSPLLILYFLLFFKALYLLKQVVLLPSEALLLLQQAGILYQQ